jgi:hypothetical protein
VEAISLTLWPIRTDNRLRNGKLTGSGHPLIVDKNDLI